MKKSMKKILVIILTVSMLISALPMSVFAVDNDNAFVQSGESVKNTTVFYNTPVKNNPIDDEEPETGSTYGDDFDNTISGSVGAIRYVIDPDTKSLELSAIIREGAQPGIKYIMVDFTVSNSPWYDYADIIENVTVKSDIKNIGQNAFSGFEQLKKVTISSDLVSINNKSFNDCTNLETVVIDSESESSLIEIGEFAFQNCKSLKTFNLPQSVTNIHRYAFDSCTSYKFSTLPSSLTTIGNGAFLGCTSLESVTIPDSVTEIGTNVFQGCKGLKRVKLPSGLTHIPEYTFYNCVNLEYSIPSNVKSIGSAAFAYCQSLREVTIPSGVTALQSELFKNCTGLKTVNFKGSVKDIYDGAFYGCKSLTKITLPESVDYMGVEVFKDCTSLSTINFDKLTKLTSMNVSVFANTGFKYFIIPANITDIDSLIFDECKNLREVYYLGKKDCAFGDSPFGGLNSSCVLYCYKGTVTESYAKEYRINYGYIKTSASNPTFSVSNAVGGIKVKWNRVAGVAAYNVAFLNEAYPEKGWFYKTVVTADNEFTLPMTGKGLYKDGASYKVSVESMAPNCVTYIGPSNIVPQTIQYFAAPTLAYAINAVGGIEFKWNKPTAGKRFYVYRKVGTGSWSKVKTTTDLQYLDKDVKEGATYTYTVRCNSSSKDKYVSSYNEGLKLQRIEPPKISSIDNINGGIKLTFKKSSYISMCRIYRKGPNDSVWKNLATTSASSYTDKSVQSNKTYSYTVCGTDSEGYQITDYNNQGTSIKYILAPYITSFVNLNGGVQITWSQSPGAVKYRVYRKQSGKSWSKLTDTKNNTCTDTSTSGGEYYWYTVRCISSDGKTYTSGYDNTGKSHQYIAAPKLNNLLNIYGGVQITWRPSAGASVYRIYRKTDGSSWSKIADTKSIPYADTNALPGTTYTYTVRCLSDDGKSTISGYDSKGLTIKYIAAPKLVSAARQNNGIQVNWQPSRDGEAYCVFRKTASSGWSKITTIKSATTKTYLDKNVVADTEYIYTVRCATRNGKSYTSGYDPVGVKDRFIAPPTISSLTNVNEGIKIVFNKSAYAPMCRIFRKTESDTDWKTLADTTGSSFVDKDVRSGSTYTYTVRCLNDKGKYISGADTKGKSRKFIAAPVITETSSGGGITIKWDKVKGAEGYRVFRRENTSSGWTKLADVTDGKTQYFDKKAELLKEYYYTVRCISSNGKSFTSGFDATGKKAMNLAIPSAPVVTSDSNVFTIKWKYQEVADGYEFEFFESGASKALGSRIINDNETTVYRLQDSLMYIGKVYAFKVRYFKTVNGTKYYSAWSNSTFCRFV